MSELSKSLFHTLKPVQRTVSVSVAAEIRKVSSIDQLLSRDFLSFPAGPFSAIIPVRGHHNSSLSGSFCEQPKQRHCGLLLLTGSSVTRAALTDAYMGNISPSPSISEGNWETLPPAEAVRRSLENRLVLLLHW